MYLSIYQSIHVSIYISINLGKNFNPVQHIRPKFIIDASINSTTITSKTFSPGDQSNNMV
jgi:hypothetical protein